MRKLFISTILGLTITGGADASIVSRGFFEEQIGNYATLDLLNSKANQKDLTALNDIVGKENWDNFLNLKLGNFPNYSELFFTDNDPNKGLGIDNLSQSTLINFTITGFPTLAGVTDKFLHGWTNSDKLTRQGLIALNDGWTDKNDGTTYLGLKDINTKIGTLPRGVAPMLSKTLEVYNSRYTIFPIDATYPQSLEELIIDLYGDTSANHPGILANLFSESIELVRVHEQEIYGNDNHTGLIDRTRAIERQIGTLPAGYDSVGAALEAINAKVDNKITNLSATASNGKYVLTAVKEGDQTTYAWESIDRSESETTTTE